MNTSPSAAWLLRFVAVLLLNAGPVAASVRTQDGLDSTRISLDLQEADIRDALRMVAKQGGLNIVISNKVAGTVSLQLTQATLREAIEAIVRVGDLHYQTQGNVLTVTPFEESRDSAQPHKEDPGKATVSAAPAKQVLVLQLRYLDAERVQPLIEKLLGEGGTVTTLKSPDSFAMEHKIAETKPGDVKGLQIGTRLSNTSQGQPARSQTLVVVDTQAALDRIQELVRGIDVKPRQVLIEARFVEISLDDTHKLGIDWNMVASASGAAAPHTFPFGNSTLGEYDPHAAGSTHGGIFPDAPNSVTIPGTPGLFTFGTLDFTSFSAVLRLIQSDSRLQVVSNPRIVVGDRQTATILVGERFPILSATVSQYGTVTEALDHYEPVGVQLEVTPSVLNEDEIQLFVRPSSSSLGPEVTGSSGLTVARINTRQIDTSVTAKDKQTVVLGGLITTRDADVKSQVPFLGSIPVLGNLFRHKSTERERVDLVVFLTVSILDGDGLSERDREKLMRSYHDEDRPKAAERTALEFKPSAPQY